jgi:hypothetical protein
MIAPIRGPLLDYFRWSVFSGVKVVFEGGFEHPLLEYFRLAISQPTLPLLLLNTHAEDKKC